MLKHFLSPSQDAARLVDLCRQSLIVDDIAGLRRLIAALTRDPEIRVLRVKNRFAGPGSAGAGGYRDVLVNLRLETPEARRLGANGHICELQVRTTCLFDRTRSKEPMLACVQVSYIVDCSYASLYDLARTVAIAPHLACTFSRGVSRVPQCKLAEF
jgi:hypothetical protein